LQRLSDYYQHHDLISGERRDPPQDCNCVSLADPNSEVFWHWWIVIGRRGDLTADDLARKAALRETDGVVVATYDRLVEAVDAID
jgi:hypothetical protein